MKKIVLINVFFGKYPWYFNLFLKSCGTNSSVDFLIFSDQHKPKQCPDNVNFISFSLKKFNDLASLKLGFSIHVKYAYKLCDIKPAYGVIFSDYIANYEYWGITDIDIVFGRIREFITDEMLQDYNIISVRNDYPTGSFMIFENNETISNLFRKSKDYQKVFTSNKHYCFDECNFEHQYLEDGGDIFEIETEIESMHHILLRETIENRLRVHFDFLIIEGLPGKLFWNNGLLSFKNEFEVLFYHLILYKSNRYTLKRNWKNIPNQLFIDKYLIRKKGVLSKIDYIFNEKLRVNAFKVLLLIEMYLSEKIKYTPLKNIDSCIYVSGKSRRFIKVNKSNINIFFFHQKSSPFELYQSLFRKNIFFLKGVKDLYYKISPDNKFLLEIISDGSTLKFDRL